MAEVPGHLEGSPAEGMVDGAERVVDSPQSEVREQQHCECRHRQVTVAFGLLTLMGLLAACYSIAPSGESAAVRRRLLEGPLEGPEMSRIVVLAHFKYGLALNAAYTERRDPEYLVNGRETYWSKFDYFLYLCNNDGNNQWLMGWKSVFKEIRDKHKCHYAAAGPEHVDILNASACTGWSEYVWDQKEMVRLPDAGVEFIIPENFWEDTKFLSAEHWPTCGTRMTNNHLGVQTYTCNMAWATTVARLMEWRLCIKQPQQFRGEAAFISSGYITSCAKEAYGGGSKDDGAEGPITGCDSGNPLKAMHWVALHGVPTGGLGANTHTCVPLWLGGLKKLQSRLHGEEEDEAPPCPKECTSPHYQRSLQEDLIFPEGWIHSRTTTSVESAKFEIRQSGPIIISFSANYHFMKHYKPGEVYKFVDDNMTFQHNAVANGFGEDYFTCMNSWGISWGDAGSFKIHKDSVSMFVLPGPMRGEGNGYPYPLPYRWFKREWLEFGGFKQKQLNGKYLQVKGHDFLLHGKNSFLKKTGDFIMYWCPLVDRWAITRLAFIEDLRSGTFCRYWALAPPDVSYKDDQDWLEFDKETLRGSLTHGSPIEKTSMMIHF